MLYCYLPLAHWIFLWYTTFLLLAHWLSLCYTAFFHWSNGYLYGTLPSPIVPLASSMLRYPFLLAYWLSQWYKFLSFCPPWLSLWYTTIFYWTTWYLYSTLPSPIVPLTIPMLHCYFLLAHWISLWYTTFDYRSTGYPYVTLQSSTGLQDISMVRYPHLFANLLSRRYTIHFFKEKKSISSAFVLILFFIHLFIHMYWNVTCIFLNKICLNQDTLLSSTGPLDFSAMV